MPKCQMQRPTRPCSSEDLLKGIRRSCQVGFAKTQTFAKRNYNLREVETIWHKDRLLDTFYNW